MLYYVSVFINITIPQETVKFSHADMNYFPAQLSLQTHRLTASDLRLLIRQVWKRFWQNDVQWSAIKHTCEVVHFRKSQGAV
jgi:hypothetical protein